MQIRTVLLLVAFAAPAVAQRAQIGNMRPSSIASDATQIDAVMSASDGRFGAELWRWDSVMQRAELLRDLRPGSPSSFPIRVTRARASGPEVFFVANNGLTGRELYYYDGTGSSARAPLRDIYPGIRGGDPAGMTTLPSLVTIFSAKDDVNGRELWRTDGTTSGTALVADLRSGTESSAPYGFTVLGSRVIFAATTSAGTELWASDGTLGGTGMVRDLWTGSSSGLPNSSSPRGFVAVPPFVYFAANSPAGRELWRTDGSFAGTTQVVDLAPGAASSNPEDLTTGTAGVAFTADAGGGRQLYLRDTGGVIAPVTGFVGGQGRTINHVTAAATGVFWFVADDGAAGRELWRTTVSATSSRQVVDLRAGPAGSRPRHLTPWFGSVIVRANDGFGAGEELFSIGFGGAVTPLLDIWPGADSSRSSLPVPMGTSTLLFAAEDGFSGIELWEIQGNPPSVSRLTDLDGDVPLPELQLQEGPGFLQIMVSAAPPSAPGVLLLGVAPSQPLPLGFLRGALLIDPSVIGTIPLFTDPGGRFSIGFPGPPEPGAPLGLQAFVLGNTRIEASGLTVWSTGQGLIPRLPRPGAAAAVAATGRGSFSDDTGEYKIVAERTDTDPGNAYVALVVVDAEGNLALERVRTVVSGDRIEFEGDIRDLLSPMDPFDPPVTSIQVRIYSTPPADADLEDGTVVWESYC
ncbi:MAG: ELWxxDGT repeat protein [Planctomycetota bacterium]